MMFLETELPEIIRESEDFALTSAAIFTRGKTADLINSFPKRSKFSDIFTSSEKFNTPQITFTRKTQRDSGMSFLLQYYQWKIVKDANEFFLLIDFGKSSRIHINQLIKLVQLGEEIPVTDHMRRAFSFTDFPLKASTTMIKIPSREIDGPLFRGIRGDLVTHIIDAFFQEFNRRVANV